MKESKRGRSYSTTATISKIGGMKFEGGNPFSFLPERGDC